MEAQLATEEGRALYRRRSPTIEPVFVNGQIKNRGIRRFQRRGSSACALEWKLIATTTSSSNSGATTQRWPAKHRSGFARPADAPPPPPAATGCRPADHNRRIRQPPPPIHATAWCGSFWQAGLPGNRHPPRFGACGWRATVTRSTSTDGPIKAAGMPVQVAVAVGHAAPGERPPRAASPSFTPVAPPADQRAPALRAAKSLGCHLRLHAHPSELELRQWAQDTGARIGWSAKRVLEVWRPRLRLGRCAAGSPKTRVSRSSRRR